MGCQGSGYLGELELHGSTARCPGCLDCKPLTTEDLRLLNLAASTAVHLYDAAESEPPGVPAHAPLYGQRDRLLELARRLDHEANQRDRADTDEGGRR